MAHAVVTHESTGRAATEVEEEVRTHDAVVLAGGATAWRDLPVPGRDLRGIYQAMEFLPIGNRVQEGDLVTPTITAEGKRVVIIGGGDTGADCLGTAHRQGAANIHQFEIMPRPPDTRAESTPWPTYPLMYRVSSAHEEGGERVFSVNTEEFVGQNGRVSAVKAHEVTMRDGKFVKVEGTDFELEADLVVYGQTEPQARLTIQNEPVHVRADGSFSMRLRFPECRRILQAVARSADGMEERKIVLAVERNTKRLEPTLCDGGE